MLDCFPAPSLNIAFPAFDKVNRNCRLGCQHSLAATEMSPHTFWALRQN